MSPRSRRLTILIAATLASGACSDAPTAPPTAPLEFAAVKFWEAGATVGWNRTAIQLFRARGPAGFGRMLPYLPLAQYRAVLAAEGARAGRHSPSPAAAAAGASVVVLSHFYPLDAAALESQLAAQRVAPPWPGNQQRDFDAGEALGREIGAAVLAFAAGDQVNQASPGLPPVGPGYWTSSGAPIVLGNYGARPFFLLSGDELRLPPPPAFGSAEFLAALAEVRAATDARTPEQQAIVVKWVPFSQPLMAELATELIVKHRRSEREAARILAYGSAANFDAIIACFDTKFAYWYVRPSQADPGIVLGTGLPNHPSYPSGHNCESGAWEAILSDAFPGERPVIEALAQEASVSRLYAGLHYRFDNETGLELGRSAGRLALERGGLE